MGVRIGCCSFDACFSRVLTRMHMRRTLDKNMITNEHTTPMLNHIFMVGGLLEPNRRKKRLKRLVNQLIWRKIWFLKFFIVRFEFFQKFLVWFFPTTLTCKYDTFIPYFLRSSEYHPENFWKVLNNFGMMNLINLILENWFSK